MFANICSPSFTTFDMCYIICFPVSPDNCLDTLFTAPPRATPSQVAYSCVRFDTGIIWWNCTLIRFSNFIEYDPWWWFQTTTHWKIIAQACVLLTRYKLVVVLPKFGLCWLRLRANGISHTKEAMYMNTLCFLKETTAPAWPRMVHSNLSGSLHGYSYLALQGSCHFKAGFNLESPQNVKFIAFHLMFIWKNKICRSID